MSDQSAFQDDGYLWVHAATLFEGCARELERVRALGMHVEAAICGHVGANLNEGFVQDLQQFDLMLQQIGAIRDVLAGMACQTGADALIDVTAAIDTIGLKDLKSRLLGDVVVADGSGGVDLFDDEAA